MVIGRRYKIFISKSQISGFFNLPRTENDSLGHMRSQKLIYHHQIRTSSVVLRTRKMVRKDSNLCDEGLVILYCHDKL